MAQTGTGSASGDTLVLGAMILGGTWATVWFMGLPPTEKAVISARVFSIVTLILAQPGVFMAAKIAVQKDIPPRRRFIKGAAIFVTFAWALPGLLSTWLQGLVEKV